MSTPTYLAIDIETTGLDPHTDAILEVAAVVLDENFNELDRFVSAIECDDEALDRADHVVLRMHLDTGLIRRDNVNHDGWSHGREEGTSYPLGWVERFLHSMIDAFPERPILLGQGVHFDRSFLREHMPNVERRFSHRHVDARTVMQLAPELPWPEPKVKHVAEHDLDATVESLRMAREWLNVGANTCVDFSRLIKDDRDAELLSARDQIQRLLDEIAPHACDGRPRDLMAQIKRALAEVERIDAAAAADPKGSLADRVEALRENHDAWMNESYERTGLPSSLLQAQEPESPNSDTLAAAQPRIEALLDIERERDEVREILGTPAGCSLTQWATDVSKDANAWRSLAREREMDL